MKILSIVLVGYRNFKLRQIPRLEYRPTLKTQLILGSNGAGKSTLLKELSPLPAHHSDFEKGGRKEIEISHNGKHYLLQSLFDQDGNRYPFIVDGENLNPGFTVTVYKELVKEHFNYTPEVHALLIGSIRFPTMSINDRRNWFMKISETDYTYALKYYQRLKEKVRDLQGALKLNQTRLTQETNKCLTEKDEEELRLKIQELNQILNTLIDHRKPRLSNPEEANQSLEQLESTLQLDISRLETILTKLGDQGISKSVEVLERDSIALQAGLQSHQNEIVKICDSIEKVQKELDAALTSSQHSLEEVQRTLREFEETRIELQSKIRLPMNFENIDSVISSLEAVKPSLEDILSQLSQCPRLDYERTTYQQLLDQGPHLNQAYLKLKDAESKLFIQKQHLESHRAKGLTECPQCKHEWYPNYDELKYKQVCKEHENLLFALGKIEKEIQDNKKSIEEHQHFFHLLERYNQNTRHFEALRPFWMYIKASGKLLEEPDSLLHLIQSLTLDLQYHKRIALLEERIKEHQKLQSLMENTKEVDVGKLKQMMLNDNERLHTLQDEMRLKHAQLETTKTQIQTLNLIRQLEAKIESLFKERKVHYQRIIEDQCVAALDEIIRNVKLNLSQYERTLSQIDIQKAIVVSLSKQIKEIEYDLDLLKKAQKALSPTEGLIAKGMTGFINHFVREVNQFIENIWLYPLEILPVEMEDDSLDLDYRFEVRVNNDPRIVPDISKASRGMQEVINLAFVAVSMKYLGLSNTPIFLDEFAASLDVSHRQSAYRAIDHLIESTDYSQVFIVSHYQDGYSSLSSSEVLVLCDSNVELPKGMVYNQHAQFH